MMGRFTRAVLVAAATLLLAPAATWAAADRKSPTTPGNLTITGTTAYSVSLAWSASTDNSGSFSYRIINRSSGTSAVVPGTQTTFTYDSKLAPLQTYSFEIYAFDAAGNISKASNLVTATLPRDTTTPGAPQVSLTDNGPTHLTLAWTTQDDDPRPIFLVSMNGLVLNQANANTSIIVTPLSPETTYTFTVQARDRAGHWSPPSEPLIATTVASDSTDTTPPTTPAGLFGGPVADCEVMLSWGESSDDVTPPQFILYELLVNGVMMSGTTLGYRQAIEYGTFDGPNLFEIVAVDEAGNRSVPASATFDMSFCH